MDSLIPHVPSVVEYYFAMIVIPIAFFLSLRAILIYLETWSDKNNDDN